MTHSDVRNARFRLLQRLTGSASGTALFWKHTLWMAGWIWRLLWLPIQFAGSLMRCCVAVTLGTIYIARMALLAGVGLLLIASVCFGLGCVLLYPLWHG